VVLFSTIISVNDVDASDISGALLALSLEFVDYNAYYVIILVVKLS